MHRRRLLIAASSVAARPAWAQVPPPRLRIGLTPVILADQAAFLARWAAYLSERLGIAVSFVARDEYQPILDLLFGGQLDAAWLCGYPYVRYQSQLRLLAVPLYRGQPTYQAYLIRPLGSSLKAWAELREKVVAYSDRLSNSGWLVAQGQLAEAGVATAELKRAFFAHGHRNVAEAVAARLAHAGSIDGYVWETMRLHGLAAASQTEVVWRSPSHGFPPLVMPAAAEHPALAALQRTLLDMPQDAAGRPLLQALNLDGFVPGRPAMFDSIRTLAQSVAGSGVTR